MFSNMNVKLSEPIHNKVDTLVKSCDSRLNETQSQLATQSIRPSDRSRQGRPLLWVPFSILAIPQGAHH